MSENLDVKKIVEKIKIDISEYSNEEISNEIISVKNIVNYASDYTSKSIDDYKYSSLKIKTIITDLEKSSDQIHYTSKQNSSNIDFFSENLIQANTLYDIPTSSKIETFVPKIIRKFILKFKYMIWGQIKFNVHMVRSLTSLKKILDDIELRQQMRTDDMELRQQMRTDTASFNQQTRTDALELKQQLRADDIEQKQRDTIRTLSIYTAYLFYLKRKPTSEEIKTWLPIISDDETFLDIFDNLELTEEAFKIKQFELQSIRTESIRTESKVTDGSSPDPTTLHLDDHYIGHKEIDDHIIYFYLQDRSYLEPFSQNKFYEYEETTILKKLLKKDMNVINIGANIGYFTLLAAREVGPQGKIFAFEPFPKTVELLQKNVDVNGYSNVDVVPMAVSDKTGTAKLALKPDSTHNFISNDISEYDTIDVPLTINQRRNFISEYDTIDVPLTTIDEYIKNQKIDFVIMDAEGFEPLILNGMAKTLEKNPHIQIITEYNPYTLEVAGNTGEKFIEIMENLEFNLSIVGSENMSKDMIKEKLLNIKYPNTATLYLRKS